MGTTFSQRPFRGTTCANINTLHVSRHIHSQSLSRVSFINESQLHLVWLSLGPVLQSGEDAIVALDDPVLLDGERLHLGSGDGHAKTNLQNPTTYQFMHTQLKESHISSTKLELTNITSNVI